MTDALARSTTWGASGSDVAGALATLLSLTSDAVLVFDEGGTILLANEEAGRLFGPLRRGLVDFDVRLLFAPARTMAECEGPLEESLPFALDGSSALVTCQGTAKSPVPVRVRCEPLGGRAGSRTYMLVARPQGVASGRLDADDEHERLVEELSRANKRLSGTLRIVLGTLDSLDVGTLFSRILGEIAETMDAWACLAYMAEHDGYRLRGTTETLEGVVVPSFVPYDHALAELVAREGHALRLRVRPPSREDLRRGEIASREVVDEETGISLEVPASTVPPFASFVAVPVWFGGHMIALIEVGWRHPQVLKKDDTRLLNAVAEYLSVQLAGAFAALRAQHAERLESTATRLRERLLAGDPLTRELLLSVFEEAAGGIAAVCVEVEGNQYQRTTMASLPGIGVHYLPADLAGISRSHALPCVLDVAQVEGLADWLLEHGEPSQGLLVALGQVDDAYRGYLLLREREAEPFEEVDVAFVRRLAEDVAEVQAGARARSRDKHISQALQRGMRNELQHVDGLSTQSCYSSATEAAFVGGDFYDLVRLPERRGCVVVGDVSGKGVEAASVSSAVKTALGAYAWEGLKPARMVSLLNDFLLGFSRLETFATMFVGMIDLAQGVLTYCSAGHPPAVLVRGKTGEQVSLGVQSGVVGAFEGMGYRDGSIEVREGDVLLLYTDGVTEARSPDGAFFGEDGLRDAVSREVAAGYDGLCDRLLKDVARFTGNSLEDDVALVVLRFDAVGL